jgi:hypothetical protein
MEKQRNIFCGDQLDGVPPLTARSIGLRGTFVMIRKVADEPFKNVEVSLAACLAEAEVGLFVTRILARTKADHCYRICYRTR